MAFVSIPSTATEVGKAIKRELWELVRLNLDDLNTRVNAIGTSSNIVSVFDFPIYNASSFNSFTGVTYVKCPASFTITNAEVQIYEKGVTTSGILSIDVKKSASLGGTYTSIFTTAPAINMAVDLDYTVSQGIFNGLNVVAAGEYLRLDVTALPSVPLSRFNILVYGTI
jgi:hypothetical protein